ncbi:MAG: DUF2914 domain-containing protein [Acidiferrobacterales bacterium]
MKIQTIALIAGALFASSAIAADDAATNTTSPAQTTETSVPAAQPPAPTGTIARSAFTTEIENREPVNAVTKLDTDEHKIYYFTELKGMEGQQVTHRWEHNGKVMAEVPFQVGGPRWRVYSSKRLENDWTGEWKVSVIDGNGSTLGVNTFTYVKAPEETQAPSTDTNKSPMNQQTAPAETKTQ